MSDDDLLRLANLSLAIDTEDHPEAASFRCDIAKLDRDEHGPEFLPKSAH